MQTILFRFHTCPTPHRSQMVCLLAPLPHPPIEQEIVSITPGGVYLISPNSVHGCYIIIVRYTMNKLKLYYVKYGMYINVFRDKIWHRLLIILIQPRVLSTTWKHLISNSQNVYCVICRVFTINNYTCMFTCIIIYYGLGFSVFTLFSRRVPAF